MRLQNLDDLKTSLFYEFVAFTKKLKCFFVYYGVKPKWQKSQ